MTNDGTTPWQDIGLAQWLGSTIKAEGKSFCRNDKGKLFVEATPGNYGPGRSYVDRRTAELCKEHGIKQWSPTLARRVEKWIAAEATVGNLI
jgi:hypothetical protein